MTRKFSPIFLGGAVAVLLAVLGIALVIGQPRTAHEATQAGRSATPPPSRPVTPPANPVKMLTVAPACGHVTQVDAYLHLDTSNEKTHTWALESGDTYMVRSDIWMAFELMQPDLTQARVYWGAKKGTNVIWAGWLYVGDRDGAGRYYCIKPGTTWQDVSLDYGSHVVLYGRFVEPKQTKHFPLPGANPVLRDYHEVRSI